MSHASRHRYSTGGRAKGSDTSPFASASATSPRSSAAEYVPKATRKAGGRIAGKKRQKRIPRKYEGGGMNLERMGEMQLLRDAAGSPRMDVSRLPIGDTSPLAGSHVIDPDVDVIGAMMQAEPYGTRRPSLPRLRGRS